MNRFFTALAFIFLTGNSWAGDLFDDETIEFLEKLDTDTLNLMPIQEKGRVKILDTYAREMMSGTCGDDNPDGVAPTAACRCCISR